jgi:hypothetical protein
MVVTSNSLVPGSTASHRQDLRPEPREEQWQEAVHPARFRPSEEARRRHGRALLELVPLLGRSDPPADELARVFAELPPGRGFSLLERALREGIAAVPEAPAALHAFFASIDEVPAWVDRAQQDRAGALVLRAGIAAGVVLGMKSLLLGYASPGGNKPLVFSGRLAQQAARRLSETSRFVQAVSQPGGMSRFAPGFAITVKVRLMHAQVRRLIARSGRWRSELWGAPINQHDMLATTLLFSVALVDGLRTLGYHVNDAEAEDVTQLWRHVGLLMGVEEAWVPVSFADGMAKADMIRGTQGAPDDDARALAQALFDARAAAIVAAGGDPTTAKRRGAAMHAVCRLLIGDELASGLGISRSPLDAWAALVRPLAGIASRVTRLPFIRELATEAGDHYWDVAVAEGLAGRSARFAPPDRLATG